MTIAAPHSTLKPARVEVHSADFIREDERHGNVWHQGPFWFTANANLTTVLTGVIGVGLGLSVVWSIAAIVLGSVFGTFFFAFHAVQGPRLGLPQMIQSRPQFGSRGSLVPLLVVVFTTLGFAVFYAILGSDSLGTISAPHPGVYEPALIAVGCAFAIVGYRLIHKFQRWLSVLVVIDFVLLTAAVLTEMPSHVVFTSGTFTWAAFLTQFGVSAGYQISIAPIVSDYTRYLRKSTSSRSILTAVFAGSVSAAIWLEILGAIVLTSAPKADTVGTVQRYGNTFLDGLGSATLAVTIPAMIAQIAISVYSAMISSVTIIDAFRPIRHSARLRASWLIVLSAVVYIAIRAIPASFLGSFGSFLSLLFYFLVPWTAVNLTDFYFVRKGHYAIAEILSTDAGLYGRWNLRGLTAYTLGLAVMIPFFSTTIYTGPAASALGGADISVLVGLPGAALSYVMLMRRASLAKERDAESRDADRLALPNPALSTGDVNTHGIMSAPGDPATGLGPAV